MIKKGVKVKNAETISSLLSQTHIDAINIPEVHDETGRGDRPVANHKRGEPRELEYSLRSLFVFSLLIIFNDKI